MYQLMPVPQAVPKLLTVVANKVVDNFIPKAEYDDVLGVTAGGVLTRIVGSGPTRVKYKLI